MTTQQSDPVAAEPGPSRNRDRQPANRLARYLEWLRQDVGRSVLVVAGTLLAVQQVLRGWIAARGGFFLDDFAFTGFAAHYPVTAGHDFLLKSYNGHLMPGAFVQVWLMTKAFPLSYGAAVAVDVVLQALVGMAVFAVLRELFGSRPVILVPFTVYLFTPMTLPAFVWWAAALNQLPQQLATALAIWCQLRYFRTGRVRTGLLGVLAVAIGLLFSEKTLFAVPAVVALSLLWFTGGRSLPRIRAAWRAHRPVWIGYGALVLGYGAYYAIAVPSPTHTPTRANDVVQLFGSAFSHGIMPELLGGPWGWHSIGYAGAIAQPTKFGAYLAGGVLVLLVAGSIALYRRAVLGWLLPVGYAVMDLGLLASSRATFIGPFIGDELRYVTDVAMIAVIGASLAVIPMAGAWPAADPQYPVRRPWVSTFTARPEWRQATAELTLPRPAAVIALVLVLFLLSAGYSTVGYDRYWSTNPSRPYLAALRKDLARLPAGTELVDQEVPAQVAWALLYPYNEESRLLKPLRNHPTFLQTGGSADRLGIIDEQGHLRQLQIQGISAAPGIGPPYCPRLLRAGTATVPLDHPTFPWTWVAQLSYTASQDVAVRLQAGAVDLPVRLHKGANNIYFQVIGAIGEVVVSGVPGGAVVCETGLVIGKPVPVPGSVLR